jgi:hypothetical protein
MSFDHTGSMQLVINAECFILSDLTALKNAVIVVTSFHYFSVLLNLKKREKKGFSKCVRDSTNLVALFTNSHK